AELELWKQDGSGRFSILKTYPVCRWSGELGHKIKEGDRQAPEGFYNITAGQMNPNSQYYLSFNLGYPNTFDKAHERTGAHLMVHGDCSSRGCYAMTDEQMGEIYSLARESFFGGQRSFQVQAYPFRMTPLNMARHRNSPHIAFWRMIKEGNDHFELSRQEPKVDVCEKRYVFNAENPLDPTAALKFNPKGHCPTYQVPFDLAQAVKEKQQQDNAKYAELVASGTRTAPVRTGADGGMHSYFLARLKKPGETLDNDGRVRVANASPAPVTMGRYVVVPPANAEVTSTVASAVGANNVADAAPVAGDVPLPRSAPQRKTGFAAAEKPSFTEKLFGGLFRSRDEKPAPAPAAVAARGTVAEPVRQARGTPSALPSAPRAQNGADPALRAASWSQGPAPSAARTRQSASRPHPADQHPANRLQGAAGPVTNAAPTTHAQAATDPPAAKLAPAASLATQAADGNAMAGAQPVLQSSNFSSRWGGFR
ncbi:MAG: hypothetical protein HY056_12555, partial [Proteobacteria bacterium]|nr:hypothetical protein [Pseudomonadota bacterium]